MNLPLRLTLTLALLATGLVIASRHPEWLPSFAGQPVYDDPNTFRLLEPPPEETVIASRRISAKTCVIEKLRAGELTLLEAAAWFRRLNAEPPSRPDRNWERLPGDTPNEKLCRQVIRWVDATLYNRAPASEIATFTCRLEEELNSHLVANGTVLLPGFDGDE
jgi:hypothetical protein